MSKFKLLQLTLITGTLVVLAGCSSTPTDDSGSSGAGSESTMAEETVTTEPADDEMVGERSTERQVTTEMMPMDEPMAEEEPVAEEQTQPEAQVAEVPEAPMPEESTVYFAFDSFALNADTRSVLNDHIAYLRENQDVTVVLEGHTDERGSAEYNLALGENRAQAVQDYMNLRGISNRQMYTTSFGEMQPAVNESNEEAWAENRRVEIQYQN